MTAVSNIDESVIGANVKAARLSAGMTQQSLADYLSDLIGQDCGWTQRTVLRIEQGERPLRLGEAVIIATGLNIPLTDLVCGLEESISAMAERAEQAKRSSALRTAIAMLPNLGPEELAAVRAALDGGAA